MIIKYSLPKKWISYDFSAFANELVEARAVISSLKALPCQRNWADELQKIQLKREVAGTSRIEGADFTEKELDAALRETPEQLHTRSQRQAAAAVKTYRWISGLKNDVPITKDLIFEIHRLIVTDADDDHCTPGVIRKVDENVTFGTPTHRGAAGGVECNEAFEGLCNAIQNEFRSHDPLVQSLAVHYHIASIHPFLDGNGRTARAFEALFLQRLGLRDTLFIALSNYYYEEKIEYLRVLSDVRQENNDLTVFIKFGLQGIINQCNLLFEEIKKNIEKALFRNVMYSLFNRLQTKKRRVLAERQIEILKILLEEEHIMLNDLTKRTALIYKPLNNARKAFMRDINHLIKLRAISYTRTKEHEYEMFICLEWPTQITETEFFEIIKHLPQAKTSSFLS